MLLSQLL